MLRYAALVAAAASAATAFIAATSAPTVAAPSALDRCALSHRFTRVTDANESGAIIETTPGRRFVVEFSNPCIAARHSAFAKLRRFGGISVCIERGDGLVFYTPGFREYRYTCRIRSIEPLKHS
jgi:hypothetical protein